MTQHPSRRPSKPLSLGTTLSVLLLSTVAFAADEATPAQRIDKASQRVSEALAGLHSLKLDKDEHDGHLTKAKSLLARARAELSKAQGQPAPTE